MTKADEIKKLDAFIAALGPNSYLGPWLSENRDRIVQDMTSDFLPTPVLPSEATRRAADIIIEAEQNAIATIERAHDKAREIVNAAEDRADRARDDARRALEAILRRL